MKLIIHGSEHDVGKHSLDEAFGSSWYEFGDWGNELVDLACNCEDLWTKVPKDIADKLRAAHARFRKELDSILYDEKRGEYR